MAKTKSNYVCTQCGAIQPKWMGKCPDCGSWNTLVENVEAPVSRFASSAVPQTAKSTVQKLEQIDHLCLRPGQTLIDMLLQRAGGR